jgi:hypothetical protein
MATPITDRKQLPDYAQTTAEQIEDLGFKWEFNYEYPVPDPNETQRVQIRDVGHQAQAVDVARYAQAMKRGTRFPPGVVTRDGRFIDFNTRAKAAWKLGRHDFPAFIVNVDYGKADGFSRERVHLLGAAFNTKGPKPLTRSELAAQIRYVAGNPDWTAEQVAKHLGVTGATVNSIFAQFRAEDRARKLGVEFNGAVTASNRALIGGRSAKLADGPFREIARLAQDAGLTSPELRDLCQRVEAVTSSDQDQLGIVEAERTERELQIEHFKATKRHRPPLSSELRRRLGWVVERESDIQKLVDYNPTSAADYLQQVRAAARVLTELSGLQSEALEGVN